MRELLPYLKLYKKHWFGLSLGMILGFLTLFASIGLLTLSGWFLSAAAVAGLTIARETFNYMLPGGGVRGLAMGRTAGRWGERVVSHNATFKLLTDLRVYFYEKLTPLIPGRVGGLRDADLLNRLVADVSAMDHVYLRLVSPVILSILGITCLTGFLVWFDRDIGLTLGAILMALVLIWPVLFYKLGKGNGHRLTQNRADLRIRALDWIEGHSELLLFGAEKRYRDKIDQAQMALMSNQAINAHITGLANALLLLANGMTLLLILWMSADGIGGSVPSPLIALVVFATLASVELLMPIAGAFQYLGQTLASARRLNEIIGAEPDVQFPTYTNNKVIGTNNKVAVEFSDISFAYESNAPLAVDNLSLSVPAGSKLAILGKTGSGKSTLLQLLTRYWDVQQGDIKIGGQALTELSESELRSLISVVSQRVDVLNGTLRDNLLIAKSDADDSELAGTLSKVGLEYLMDAPGLDQWLGDGGRQLSGGEKRRIGIARAVLHNAPILLLDEPTEGLDRSTESQIMSLLEQHYQDKTVVFVTHRLVGLSKMDNVVVLEQGKLVEQGQHSELLKQKGRYFQLHQAI
ncbi:cysteine/glutathione ABC transporter ATP-binding protein/permease CydC [Vibrio breoganii]|uniref:heme ABC transporter ATP-binding protein/permease CydC n=1 Tax=Vibrio breoganii TaxID=553239 RepID=UPI0002F8DD26|nr:cysteine/glutathione ABC transporter ATP-binding protein/permease CydC [Vibrio breoganii]OED93721.1 cysteine/glutathione ABC transporter ATP-binding protein/permease CydC [Vibrio breoganii ZF-29]OEF84999.1 cysteine/glutathione ABC transporter ATP-binding protein/permease CydC [Vibrio breoganii 1C10]PMI24161.1 cysteine/glutathione ABC transporter ATP-binding protein/permease CydC [Vibrio breoganii]PMK53238.1 cysteine/glutathione ABC transporter ATP-binding protein/permease CydC [Vibrio breoga